METAVSATKDTCGLSDGAPSLPVLPDGLCLFGERCPGPGGGGRAGGGIGQRPGVDLL